MRLWHPDVEEYLRPFVPHKWVESLAESFKNYDIWSVYGRTNVREMIVNDLLREIRLPDGMKPHHLKECLLAARYAPRGT